MTGTIAIEIARPNPGAQAFQPGGGHLSMALAAALWAWSPADAAPAAAGAQPTIYRCGNTYTDRPCPNAAPVAASDQRTADQVRAAQDSTVSAQKTLRQMQADQRAAAKADREAAARAQQMPIALSAGPHLRAASARDTNGNPSKPPKSPKNKAEAASSPVLYAVPKPASASAGSR